MNTAAQQLRVASMAERGRCRTTLILPERKVSTATDPTNRSAYLSLESRS